MTRTEPFSHQAVFHAGLALTVGVWAYFLGAIALNWDRPHIAAIGSELMRSAEFKSPVGFNYVKGLLK